jgi:hypothetical protein
MNAPCKKATEKGRESKRENVREGESKGENVREGESKREKGMLEIERKEFPPCLPNAKPKVNFYSNHRQKVSLSLFLILSHTPSLFLSHFPCPLFIIT